MKMKTEQATKRNKHVVKEDERKNRNPKTERNPSDLLHVTVGGVCGSSFAGL
jgi:hypothetical protein